MIQKKFLFVLLLFSMMFALSFTVSFAADGTSTMEKAADSVRKLVMLKMV